MKLLILGGTVFLGRALVEAALAAGHQVTLFNRGQHNPEWFPSVEKLRGDRNGQLDALAGRRWDAVIDTCGYVPRIVRLSAEALADKVDHYTFISTISVYKDTSQVGIDEQSPVGTIEDETTEQITGETYGPLKALCEQAAATAMPGRVLTLRPGLIVGPYDPTDRFAYWPLRVAEGGRLLAPGRPGYPTQVIDVRDLAEWNIRLVEQGQTGLYNATGPDYPLTLGEVIDTARSISGSDARPVWVSEEFLLAEGVQPWSELPLWVPESNPQYAGFSKVNVDKAIQTGLAFRPLADTVRDTLIWERTRPTDRQRRAGMTREREAALLQKWGEGQNA
ncbi:MAG: SDR family oxidoreductase [Anaerolineae bacterium]|nr:SDR family oxidoreductase [Anaerolineae bacterium]